MEVIVSLAIGILGASGVWLLLRPRTFQVLIGLALLSYAVNLFIFSMGSLSINDEPIVRPGIVPDLEHFTDPMPQALVLTAIVIGFATTALFLVVLMAARGLTRSDHVDGEEPGVVAPGLSPPGSGHGSGSVGPSTAPPRGGSAEGATGGTS